MAFEGSGNLRHLHQAEHSFLHASTARRANDQQGQALVGGFFNQAGDALPHHGSHRPSHEPKVHHREGHGEIIHPACSRDHRISETCLGLGFPKAIGIGTAILEPKRIGRFQLAIDGGEAAWISNQGNALGAVDPVVMAAVAADVGIGN